MPEQTQKPVQNQLTSEANEAFAAAEESIFAITEQPEFAESCLQLGLDPIKSTNTPAYWDIVSEFALRDIDERRAKGEDELTLSAFELTALTPSFLHTDAALRDHTAGSAKEQRQLKSQASYYNSLLRYVGSNFDVKASDITLAAENVAAIAGLAGPTASHDIRRTVRGAQHEMAFSQILSHTPYAYEGASLDQDLHGVDYVVNVGGKNLPVDVKASLSEVEALGGDKSAFAIRWPRHQNQEPVAVMYSLAQDADFHDSFHIPDELAAERASVLSDLLVQAQKLQSAA